MTLATTAVAAEPATSPAEPPATASRRTRTVSPVAIVAGGFLLVVVVAVALAPVLSPYDPLEPHFDALLQMPSRRFLLGTDTLGRDVLSRLLWGGRPALVGALEATAVFAVLGVVFGLVAGYSKGIADRVISGVVDLTGLIPSIVVVFAVLALFGNSLSAAMISAGLFGSYGLIRIVRASTQETREELYVAAARVSGLGPIRIMARHVLPRLINPIVVQLSIFFGIALVLQSGLGYMNLGVTAPSPSWGGMVGEGATVIQKFPWLLVPPGVAIALTVLATVLVGDALQAMRATASLVTTSRRRTRVEQVGESAVDEPVGDESVSGRAADGGAPAPALLEVRDLSVSLPVPDGLKQVVRNATFAIEPGELVGLVGESGSGKTITALSLLGLLPKGSVVTAGALGFDGRTLLEPSLQRFRELRGTGIGLVSQEPMVSLDPSFTVGQQLAEVLKANGRATNAKHARELALAGLADVRLHDPDQVLRRYPFQLSGGMAQRVSIAMALAGQPKLLIADEPTTALDVTVQAEILDLLRALRDQHGMAVLLVTHNLGVVADFCERVLVMRSAELIETGDVRTIFEAPRQDYTRALLAATPSLVDLDDERRAAALAEGSGR